MKLLIDKNINHKELKKFIADNNLQCEVFGLNAEQHNKKVEQKPGLLILGGPTKLPGRFASRDTSDNFEEIKKIVGKDNLGDCLHFESAMFEGYDYLITDDNDLISKSQQLKDICPKLELKRLSEFKEQMKIKK